MHFPNLNNSKLGPKAEILKWLGLIYNQISAVTSIDLYHNLLPKICLPCSHPLPISCFLSQQCPLGQCETWQNAEGKRWGTLCSQGRAGNAAGKTESHKILDYSYPWGSGWRAGKGKKQLTLWRYICFLACATGFIFKRVKYMLKGKKQPFFLIKVGAIALGRWLSCFGIVPGTRETDMSQTGYSRKSPILEMENTDLKKRSSYHP